MRGLARRLTRLRPAAAGRHGLPVALAALAVVVAASTAASGVGAVDGPPAVAAGTTLPQVVPPTYTYLEAPGATTAPGPSGTTGTGVQGAGPAGDAAPALASNGVPQRALEAYRGAAAAAGCGVSWSLLAAIGRVESNHGRFAGATLLADGRTDPPIIGIPLDGRPGVATITDTDSGRYDGDTVYDRAVGPMQFIPGTWAMFAADGDRDGRSDPTDLDDAAAAAAEYLCRAGGDLSTGAGQQDAVFSYNRSDSYVRLVLDLAAEYERGGTPVDDRPAPDRTPQPLPPVTTPTLPPVAVGPPPAITPPPAARPAPRPTPGRTTPTPTPGPTTRPAPGTPAPTTAPPTSTAPPSPTAPPTTPPVTPSPTCTPVPTPTVTPSGSVTPQATPTGSPSASPSASPSVTPEASPSGPEASPSATPTPSPSGTPTPSPSPSLPPCPTP